jgi:hypothetical protein
MIKKMTSEVLLWILLLVALFLPDGQCWCYDTVLTQLRTASSLDFSPDNITFVAVDSVSRHVNFWRIDTKELIFTYITNSTPNTAKFSKDGSIVGIGTSSGDVVLLYSANYSVYGRIAPNGGVPIL